MLPITCISQLSYHTNIETYFLGDDKYIILYDDHRCLLNIIFEAHKLGLFSKTPNLLYFDRHEDACGSPVNKGQLLERFNVKRILDITDKDFWSFVEFDLSGIDDDWLLTGMEIGLINDAVLVGQKENCNIANINNLYEASDGSKHQIYSIDHLNRSLGCRGCLGDNVIKDKHYENIRNILEYNQPPTGRYDKFSEDLTRPIILDFDLDCFTTDCEDARFAWPEMVFRKIFYDNYNVRDFICRMTERASFITICREPGCCGGIGESNKILSYLDKYLFNGSIGTNPI